LLSALNAPAATSCRGSKYVPYLAGVLTGVVLTIVAVFVIDHVKTGATSAGEPQKIVNWNVAEQRLRSSLGTLKEEVHEATR